MGSRSGPDIAETHEHNTNTGGGAAQWQATPEAIAAAALDLLQNEAARQTMRAGYAKMRAELGPPGACKRTADLILEALVEGAGAEPSG